MKKELNDRIDYCPNCTKTWWDYETPWGPVAPRLYSENPVLLILKEGKYGKFWGCPNFPKCKYHRSFIRGRRPILDYEDEVRPY